MPHATFLQQAITLSQESADAGGYPAGALVVRNGEVLGTGISNGKQLHDPTSHAEIAAIRAACQKAGHRDLPDAALYTSLEPCLMCYSATLWAHIPRIVYACSRDKVTTKYYEGDHNAHEIYGAAHRNINLEHVVGLEPEALAVIHEWEKALVSK